MKKLICIDNGHGIKTPGKRSPDGKLLEYKWCREVAKMLKEKLNKMGIQTYMVTPEDADVPIGYRVRRVNQKVRASKLGAICISIHNNAAGSDGGWHNATGWECFVAPNASQNSKVLARCLYEAAEDMGVKVRKNSPVIPYKTKNLGICRDTNCPAVLVENFFMDNWDECAWLVTEEGKNTCVDIMIEGIAKFLR